MKAAIEAAFASVSRGDRATGLAASLERLADAWRRHVVDSEDPEGLLADIVDQAPHLSAAVAGLREQHRVLAARLRRLRLRLIAAEGPTRLILEEASGLLSAMVDHHQRGASLVWDAFNVDNGCGY
jgi:hypothetical protein